MLIPPPRRCEVSDSSTANQKLNLFFINSAGSNLQGMCWNISGVIPPSDGHQHHVVG